MKRIIKLLLGRLGFEVRRKHVEMPVVSIPAQTTETMKDGLQRINKKNILVNTIIDVGAATGSWTRLAKVNWPNANYVLFEPLEERKAQLEKIVATNENYFLVTKIAGKKEGKTNFIVAGDLDGSGVYDAETSKGVVRELEVVSIEMEIKRLALPGPYIIKLDTHGFEIPIIEGCSSILNEINLFIIECYGFNITKDSLLFWEMCRYMENLGFRLIDVVDIMRRPNDDAFWQCDAFFIPAKTELFNINSYR